MQHVNEVALPLLLDVRQALPRLTGLRLDASGNAPLVSAASREAHDPFLRTLAVDEVDRDAAPLQLAALLDRCEARHGQAVEMADVMCAVCAAAVDSAAADGSIKLGQVRRASHPPDPQTCMHAGVRASPQRCCPHTGTSTRGATGACSAACSAFLGSWRELRRELRRTRDGCVVSRHICQA